MGDGMRISTLVVTNRPQFVPWWCWNIRKQTFQPDEVAVASNYHDCAELRRLIDAEKMSMPVRLSCLPTTASIGELRQAALDLATGDIVTWFDDDDWQWSENIERMTRPIMQYPKQYRMVVYPFSHKLSIKTATVYPIDGANEPWLPSTAVTADIAKQCTFEPLSQAEDVYWLEQVHKLVGINICWDFFGKAPNMNVMLIMHGDNVYSQEWRQKYDGAPRSRPLAAYPHKNVSTEEWRETLCILKRVFGVEPPVRTRL